MVFSRPLIRNRISLIVFMSLLAGLLVLGVGVAPNALALAGDLDTTFSGDGIEVTPIAPPDYGRGVALLPDGRIVVVGTSQAPPLPAGYNFEVAIYLPSGGLDTSFSGDGKAVIDLGGTADFAESVAVMIEDDGPKIIIAGCTATAAFDQLTPEDPSDDNCATGGQFAVIKVLPGSTAPDPRDLTFGGDGVANTTTLTDAHGHDVVIQPNDDKIIVAGATTNSATGRDFALARFNPDGTIDTTWGPPNGVITSNFSTFGKHDEAWAVTLQFTDSSNNFKVVAAGQSDNTGPSVTTPSFDVAVARYDSSGVLDPNFAPLSIPPGFTTTDHAGQNDFGYDVKVQPPADGQLPGKIIVAGTAGSSTAPQRQFFVVRYDNDGSLDETFDSDGKQVIDVPGGTDSGRLSEARGLDIQPNRKPVLVGYSKSSAAGDPEFAVVRLFENGGLDTSFNTDGIVTRSLGDGADDAYDVVIQQSTPTLPLNHPDGKIVVAGSSGPNIGVARFFGDPVAFLTGPGAVTEGHSGLKSFTFKVTLSAVSSERVVLGFQTSDGTDPATSATGCAESVTGTQCDYTHVSRNVTITAGTPISTLITVDVPVRGDSLAEPDETFEGLLSVVSGPATVSPTSNKATATIVNDDAAAVGINDVQALEGVSGTVQDFQFTVTQSIPNPPGVTTTISFETRDGTAEAADPENDYESRSGSVDIPPGASSAPVKVTVTVNGDDRMEPDEDFFVNLTNVSCAPSGCLSPTLDHPHSDRQGKGTIQDDDDTRPKVSIGDDSAPEGDPPSTTIFDFTVTITGTTTETVTVTYQTDNCTGSECGAEGRASVPADYEPASGTVVFGPGSGTRLGHATVTVNGGEEVEREFDEYFIVSITAQGNGVVVEKDEGRGTILDDDGGGGDPGDDCSPNTSFFGYDSGFTGGVYVASGYVDGDICADIITAPGQGGGPHVRVFSGADGREIMGFMAYSESFTGGVRVAAGDVNGDGFDDIITAPGPGGGPHVRVFSGNGGGEITGFMAYDPRFTAGVYVASGYVNDDGFADIITGPDSGGGPHVRVFSGDGGGEIMGFMAYSPGFTGGVRVASTDVNGDLFDDVIVGPGPGGGPHVRVFSGNGGGEVMGFMAYDPGFTGGVFVAGGYVNDDQYGDIVTGPGPGGGPHIRVVSGSGGGELRSLFAYDPSFRGGVRVASNDINGDGLDDVITGPGPGGGPHIVAFLS